MVQDLTEEIPAHTRRKAADLKMGIETLFVLLVISVRCIFQPTFDPTQPTLTLRHCPWFSMKSAPFNQNLLVVISTEVSES